MTHSPPSRPEGSAASASAAPSRRAPGSTGGTSSAQHLPPHRPSQHDSLAAQLLGGLLGGKLPTCPPWKPIHEEKLIWQSQQAAVSPSLPRVGGGEGGSKQTSPTGPFPTTLHSWPLLHCFKTGSRTRQWKLSHPESQRPRNQEGENGHLILALPATVLGNAVPDLTGLGQFRKGTGLPQDAHRRIWVGITTKCWGGVKSVLPVPCSWAALPLKITHDLSTPGLNSQQCPSAHPPQKRGRWGQFTIRDNNAARDAVCPGQEQNSAEPGGLLFGSAPYFRKPHRASSAVHALLWFPLWVLKTIQW